MLRRMAGHPRDRSVSFRHVTQLLAGTQRDVVCPRLERFLAPGPVHFQDAIVGTPFACENVG